MANELDCRSNYSGIRTYEYIHRLCFNPVKLPTGLSMKTQEIDKKMEDSIV
jgi:hypothetical protein